MSYVLMSLCPYLLTVPLVDTRLIHLFLYCCIAFNGELVHECNARNRQGYRVLELRFVTTIKF